jgi:prophage tail gpP-like protein
MNIDDLIITSGTQSVSGWTDIRVTRGIERLPSDFAISMTEEHPDEFDPILLAEGDPCVVSLGDDLVITGYIDHNVPSIDANDHTIHVVGRSKCSDLVDCSVEWKGGQISNSTVHGVAQRLSSVYGIEVSTNINNLPIIPQTNLMLGESPFEIIDRMARFSSVLVYDLPDGNLFLTQSSVDVAASGFTGGVNVLHAHIDRSADIRYSDYDVYIQSVDMFSDLGDSGNKIANVKDFQCKRHRRMVIISEGGGKGLDIAYQRGIWERERRIGRSMIVKVIADSWRDVSGALWEPNTLVPVHLPRLKLPQVNLLISEVTYRKNSSGTTAELTLMRPEAFTPQPINLTPFAGDVAQVHP